MMNEKLTEEHSWTDPNNQMLLADVDPETLDTSEKREVFYNRCLRKTPLGLQRTTPYEHRKQLHPNHLLAKVEHFIRVMYNNA